MYLQTMPISHATIEDAPALVSLINSAYRGDVSTRGWTSEAHIIGDEVRILQPQLEDLLQKPTITFLKANNEVGGLEGCVFLEKRGEQLYLGMLSVDPNLQARGTGKQLMLAAEEHAREQGCSSIYMRVINLRKELIAWYIRRGYYDTGRTENYEAPDLEKIKIPFHFVILQKDL